MTDQDHTPVRIAGLLLAAGGGRRLGGRPKALLPHHARPLIEHAVRALREAGCGPLYVVLGAASDEVRAQAALPGCVLLDNPDWEAGMGSSLRLGLRALASGAGPEGPATGGPAGDASVAGAAVVSLVDQPGIGAEAVARVRGTYRSTGSLAAAAYSGRRGHPVLLGSAHWSGIARSASGDRGARGYLREHAGALTLVECGDIADPSDIDTPADLDLLGP